MAPLSLDDCFGGQFGHYLQEQRGTSVPSHLAEELNPECDLSSLDPCYLNYIANIKRH